MDQDYVRHRSSPTVYFGGKLDIRTRSQKIYFRSLFNRRLNEWTCQRRYVQIKLSFFGASACCIFILNYFSFEAVPSKRFLPDCLSSFPNLLSRSNHNRPFSRIDIDKYSVFQKTKFIIKFVTSITVKMQSFDEFGQKFAKM